MPSLLALDNFSFFAIYVIILHVINDMMTKIKYERKMSYKKE